MTKTALDVADLKTAARTAPEIDPARVTLHHSGQCWREYMVRVPADFVADDLKEPGVWRKLQNGSRNSLRKFDRLFIVAFNEEWVAEAIVASADMKSAVLAKPRVTSMPTRFDKLFEDEKYRVAWNGFGYVVERKSDGHPMTQPTANAELATRLLAQLYPARVA
ncbi:hypothetical protein FJ955_03895 [Mesorhizobium sp. B2-2-2]|uniref:hypothetical protein n=1 Tax=Mesorhizobium sp. B2-2-2 TaxID=2589964 RepID=UPI00112840C8|nr:hypothetical protein [Mesorhizobium sp. B2-2-2]TPM33886.1 hypothetical protein FJ955_03895 [Mesorhizobium sp. B2-2-2]